MENKRNYFSEQAELFKRWGNQQPTDENLQKHVLEVVSDCDRKQQQLNAVWDAFDECGLGLILKHRADRWATILPCFDDSGKVRIQYFDRSGFSGHSAYRTIQEALLECVREGFGNVESSDKLDELSATSTWIAGSARTAIMNRYSAGQIDWEAAAQELERVANSFAAGNSASLRV